MTFLLLLAGATLADGLAAVKTGEYEKARQLFAEYVNQRPKDPGVAQATLWLARLEPDPVIARDSLYPRIPSLYPNSPYADSALMEAASINYALGLYQQAATIYKQFLGFYPSSPLIAEANYWLGLCLIILGDTTSARTRFAEVGARSPGSMWAGLAKKELEAMGQVSVAPASEHEGFAVQVGSFTDRDRAENVLSEYQAKARPGEIRQAAIAGTTYYRVWLGPFGTEQEASSYAQGLKNQGKAAMVVKR